MALLCMYPTNPHLVEHKWYIAEDSTRQLQYHTISYGVYYYQQHMAARTLSSFAACCTMPNILLPNILHIFISY